MDVHCFLITLRQRWTIHKYSNSGVWRERSNSVVYRVFQKLLHVRAARVAVLHRAPATHDWVNALG